MQVSSVLRRGRGRYFHWCPACEEMHPLPDSWTFNGDADRPSFSPSFKHTFFRRIGDQAAKPQGEMSVCHYIITDGLIQFCVDSWHKRSDIVAMPPIPEHVRDFGQETQD